MKLGDRKLLILILSLQFTFLGLIALDWIGLEIPIIRQVITFIYLTFVPGLLLLGILRINNLNTPETILYAVGLSLSSLMFIGFLINLFYPLIGISKPISETPLVATISVIVLFFCLIFYWINKEFEVSLPDKGDITSPLVFLLMLLPFISIFGAHYLNYHNDNTILLVMFGIISTVPVFMSLNKLPNKILPLIIWTISISLLFSVSLSGRYVVGGDASIEYYYANLVSCQLSIVG